ncbi:hypothetical protein BS50DRAFT_567335 [Corynespora cassiicola Philippines]|uniref:Uncharacterized protein n=1 Tax=Corynespora cassiicola Philippines TaxID=1448308 RepID=A0A2T2PA18_CORCC|nr:hypothetical protein BS50DRAFT_567335 [Corynespora cassiicola Philippines]
MATEQNTTIQYDAIHSQEQSPLFGKIPAEIRNEIFLLALQQYVDPDPEKRYAIDTYYTRPGCEGPIRQDTQLLWVCKRIHTETKNIPFWDHEVVFWLGSSQRAPPDITWKNGKALGYRYVRALSQHQRLNIRNARVYGQMYALGDPLSRLFSPGVVPHIQKLVVTIRYTDWWWWEDNSLPTLDMFIDMESVKLPPSVNKVQMELENREANEKVLDGIVNAFYEHPDRWHWKTEDGTELRIQGETPKEGIKEWKWLGPTKFEGESFEHHGKEDKMSYVVKVVTWQAPKQV